MPNKVSKWIPARVALALLCATGVMELYISRTNLSIAIVAMVQTVSAEGAETNSTGLIPYCLRENVASYKEVTSISNFTNDEDYYLFNNITNKQIQEYESNNSPRIKMTSLQRGNILSAFFYAYGISGIVGGRLAEIYGTKLVFGVAVFVDALINFLIPIAAKTNYGFFFFLRFAMGIFQGCCYPSLHAAAAKWIPPQEQASFVAFVYPANTFGSIFTLSVFGIIISKYGWESVFYISGSISLLWLVFWIFLMYDSPEKHPRISEEEKLYIARSLSKDKNSKKMNVPWIKMLTSVPIWAINVAYAGHALGLSFLLTQLPIYMSSIIGVNIRNNGFISSLPFLARYCFGNLFGWISTYLIKNTNISKTTMKRIFTLIGFGGPALCLVSVGFAGCNIVAATALFITGTAMKGANLAGSACNHLDLTYNYSGTALGISSTVGYLYAMIGPVMVGGLTPEETLEEWKIVYWVVFTNYVIAGSLYAIFVSTERQPWDVKKLDAEQMKAMMSKESVKGHKDNNESNQE